LKIWLGILKIKSGFQSNFGGFYILASDNLKSYLTIKILDLFFANNLMSQIIIIDMCQIGTNITAHLILWVAQTYFLDIKKKRMSKSK